jgi:hypothetical protein
MLLYLLWSIASMHQYLREISGMIEILTEKQDLEMAPEIYIH